MVYLRLVRVIRLDLISSKDQIQKFVKCPIGFIEYIIFLSMQLKRKVKNILDQLLLTTTSPGTTNRWNNRNIFFLNKLTYYSTNINIDTIINNFKENI